MERDGSRRNSGLVVLVVLVFGAALAALVVDVRSPAFSWFRATPAPAGWHRVVLPDGVTMSYPAALVPVRSDPGAASVERQAGGLVVTYLNATPWSGPSPAHGWAEARLDRLGDENDHVSEVAEQDGLRFAAGATGSCVADHYTTRVGRHRYDEVACLVRGRSGRAVVVVGAASAAAWPAVQPTLRRALEAVRV